MNLSQESHQKEISKNEEQIEFVKLELEKAEKVHDAIGGRLDLVNQKIIAEENELRSTAHEVRTQTKDERQSKSDDDITKKMMTKLKRWSRSERDDDQIKEMMTK